MCVSIWNQLAEHAIAQLQAKPKDEYNTFSVLGIPKDSTKFSKVDFDKFAQIDGNTLNPEIGKMTIL